VHLGFWYGPAVPVDVRDEEGGIRILTLARPPANALDAELIAELGEATRAAGTDERVRAVILRGNDRFFSGGLDLKKMAGGEAPRVSEFGYGDGIGALWTLPKPTIAEVRGHAIAGGAILLLACDFRISARGVHKIGLNETPIGLAFPPGAFEISRLAIAHTHFGRAILEGELYSPEEALRVGYLQELVDPDRLSARCLELARKVATFPAGAYAYNKAMLQKPALERCMNEPEADKQRRFEVWTSEETLNAFLARAQGLSKK
jgi:enoyl-CoA hydratase